MLRYALSIGMIALFATAAWNHLTAQPPQTSESGLKNAPASAERPEKASATIELSEKPAPSEADLRKALETPVQVNFIDTPLNDAIQFIAKNAGVNIWIDEKALREEGLNVDIPIDDLVGKPIAAARVLDRILEPLGLTWIIHNDVVQVTTIIAAREILITRTYPVGDLIEYAEKHQSKDVAQTQSGQLQFVQFGGSMGPFPGGSGSIRTEVSPEAWLMGILQMFTDGSWLHSHGTGGSLSYLKGNLVIRQTHNVQQQCKAIIQTIRQFTKGELEPNPVSIRPPHYAHDEDPKVRKALEKVINVRCKKLSLKKFFRDLETKLEIPIDVEQYSLFEENVTLDQTVTLNLEGVPAKSLLKTALKPMGLRSIVEDGRLFVTTIIAGEERLFTKIHDIRDLHESGYGGEKLIDLLFQETSGPWIEIDGTGGTIQEPLDGLLAVWQVQRVHHEVEAILADLREQAAKAADQAEKDDPADPQAVTTKFYTLPDVADLPAVQKAIFLMVEPDSWAENNEEAAGKIIQIDRTLVVKNRNDVHVKLKKFLDDLEKAVPTLQHGAGLFRVPSPAGSKLPIH